MINNNFMTALNLIQSELNEFQQKTGLASVPEWAWKRVIPMENIQNYYFYYYVEDSTSIQEVELNNVAGTDHPSYNNGSWVKMLLNLSKNDIKSITQAYRAIDTPKNPHDVVTFNKYGENYIITNGNHRSCFAKFGLRKKVTAKVVEYVLDSQAATAFNYLKRYFDTDYKSISHIEFKSAKLIVITCDRNELIAFYNFFSHWNGDEIKKLKMKIIFTNKVCDLTFGFIDRCLFPHNKSYREAKKKNNFSLDAYAN